MVTEKLRKITQFDSTKNIYFCTDNAIQKEPLSKNLAYISILCSVRLENTTAYQTFIRNGLNTRVATIKNKKEQALVSGSCHVAPLSWAHDAERWLEELQVCTLHWHRYWPQRDGTTICGWSVHLGRVTISQSARLCRRHDQHLKTQREAECGRTTLTQPCF